MNTALSRATLKTRRLVKGDLVLQTAIHVGAGRIPARGTDSPIIRDGSGLPFIPGSSIKGAVRAAVERIVPNLDVAACGLYNKQTGCLTPLQEEEDPRKSYRTLQEAIGRRIKDSDKLQTALSCIAEAIEEDSSSLLKQEKVSEDFLLSLLDQLLCPVCKAFGSPFISSAIYFHDAPIKLEKWVGFTQVRDGVGIDRDSGRAVDKLKYDYEIVPPGSAFDFSITIETDDSLSLGLAALGLNELVNGNIPLGGIRSRGLGRCRLDGDHTTVESVNLGEMDALKAYLTKGETHSQPVTIFVENHVKNLWKQEEGRYV